MFYFFTGIVVIFRPDMAVNILNAYEGTLEEDFPPDSERYEHSEMLLYKVMKLCVYLHNSHMILCNVHNIMDGNDISDFLMSHGRPLCFLVFQVSRSWSIHIISGTLLDLLFVYVLVLEGIKIFARLW